MKLQKIRKILLINPSLTMAERYGRGFSRVGTILPPLGLMYVAAQLEKYGFHVKIFDFQISANTFSKCLEVCKEFCPGLIGISCVTANFGKAAKLASLLKNNFTIPIVFGGPHPTIDPEGVLQLPSVDFVVKGEGEFSIIELIKVLNSGYRKDFYNIKGIGFKDKGVSVFTEKRASIGNLDLLPFPARHLVQLKNYYPALSHYKRLPTITMVTSRGCPFSCTFCSSSSIWGRSYRQRSVDNVIEEIRFLIKEYGIKDINFWDDIFGLDKKWIADFCDRLVSEKLDLTWSCELKVNAITEELLKKMEGAGCWAIYFGIETTDEGILEKLNKQISLKQIKKTVELCKNADLEVRANFILGLPGETPLKVKNMVKEIIKMNPDYVKFNILSPFPGTVLYEQLKSGKFGELDESFDLLTGHFPVFRPWGYSNLEEIEQIRRWAYLKFYLRPYFLFFKLSKIKSIMDIRRQLSGFRALFSI